jgi:hypothetical protein
MAPVTPQYESINLRSDNTVLRIPGKEIIALKIY